MSDEQHDDDLRALLSAADPAATLPAADPAGAARLMEDTMSRMPETTETATTETRGDGLRDRSPLTWIVAAAAAAVIVGGAAFAVLGGDEKGPGAASGTGDVITSRGEAAPEAGETPSVTELDVSTTAAPGRCLAPESAPQVVAVQSLVVDASVTSISGGVVTLAPTRFYAGEPTDLVTVSEPGGDLQMLLSAVDFEEGGRYLVSATDGRVTLCGFSAPYSARLAAVYDEAFAG